MTTNEPGRESEDADEIDAAEVQQLLNGIPGVEDRVAAAREAIARGEGITLDDLDPGQTR